MTINSLQKICVILGAGASHDVLNDGTKLKDPNWKPPLAIDLFNIKNNPVYDDLLLQFRGARALAPKLAPRIAKGMVSVEAELAHYASHPDTSIKELFKFVPPYLRELLYMCGERYTSTPASYVELVITLLSDEPHEVMFVVLNYDRLLEKALELVYPKEFIFGSLNDYVRDERRAKIVKLHGSVDWFKSFGNTSRPWYDEIEQFDPFQEQRDDEIVVSRGQSTTGGHEGTYLFPVLTAPITGKRLTDVVCPTIQIDAAQDFLKDCRKFLIIGTSGLDEDLMELLDSSIDINTNHNLQVEFVSKGRTATNECQARFEKSVRAFDASRPMLHVKNQFRDGFSAYLSSEQFAEFARVR